MKESQDRLMTSALILSHENLVTQPDPPVQFQGSQETAASSLEPSGQDHEAWSAAMTCLLYTSDAADDM
eukprot:586542-Prorocentrum_lima.AAC.1